MQVLSAAACGGDRRGVTRALVAFAVLVGSAAGVAGPPEPIDLAALDDVAAVPEATVPAWDGVSLQPVSNAEPAGRRFYVTGILGDSFATLADPVYGGGDGRRINGSLLTAGGAAGMALARDDGQWRFEVEGRGRDDLTRTVIDGVPPIATAHLHWAAADGWSATANIWRDWWIGERWGAYLGGGLGGGGYRYSFAGDLALFGANLNLAGDAQVAAFAWQAGFGAVYELTERVSFDVGYRFFSIAQSDVTYSITTAGLPLVSNTLPQQFTAGEVLFALRVYEPFRRWR